MARQIAPYVEAHSDMARRCKALFVAQTFTVWVKTDPDHGQVAFEEQRLQAPSKVTAGRNWENATFTVEFDVPGHEPTREEPRHITDALVSEPGLSMCTITPDIVVKRTARIIEVPSPTPPRPQQPATPPVTPTHRQEPHDNILRDVGIGVMVAGAFSGAALGIGFGAAANSNESKSNKQCGPSAGYPDPKACTQEGLALNRAAQSYEKAAYWSLGMGALATAAGLVVFIIAPAADNAVATVQRGRRRLRLEPVVARNGSGIVVQASW